MGTLLGFLLMLISRTFGNVGQDATTCKPLKLDKEKLKSAQEVETLKSIQENEKMKTTQVQ